MVATGKAPISGGIAIVFSVVAVVILVIAIFGGVSWNTVVSAFTTAAMFIMVWRGMKKHEQEYQERLERLDERLGRNETCPVDGWKHRSVDSLGGRY